MVQPNLICLNLGTNYTAAYQMNTKVSKLMDVTTCNFPETIIKEKRNLEYLQAMSSISQCSSESHRKCFNEFCRSEDFVEIQLVHGSSAVIDASSSKQSVPLELDVSLQWSDEKFRRQWKKILQDYKTTETKILITLVQDPMVLGNESPGKVVFAKESSGSNGIMFTSLNDDPQANCACSRFAITCAVVLAGCLAINKNMATTNYSGPPNPLTFVDRVLPGISQVCDFGLCKRLLDIN